MASGPCSITIEEATERLIDYRGKTPAKTSKGVRLVTAKVIKGGQILDEPSEYIAADYYDEWMRRGLPRRRDVLITTEAPLGEVAMLKTDDRVALAQRVILLRARAECVDPSYLLFALQSEFAQAELRARGSGTTVLGIKQSELRRARIPHFPIERQRRIASILSAYDDLIENCQRRSRILEDMARGLYREWFVHFRFPGADRMPHINSPLGLIPRGWEVRLLRELAAVNRQQVSARSASADIYYIDIASVSPGRIDAVMSCRFSDAPQRARRVVQHGDVLWSCVRPNRRSHALVMSPAANTIASTGFAVLSPTRVPYSYLYNATTTDDFVAYLTNHATGAAYPAVTAKTFEDAALVLPDKSLLADFASTAEPIYEMAHGLGLKITNLRRTRDLLLPRLMSGQIDLRATEDAVPA